MCTFLFIYFSISVRLMISASDEPVKFGDFALLCVLGEAMSLGELWKLLYLQ